MTDDELQIRKLARELASDSIVTKALERLILQIVCEIVPYARKKERERIANALDGYKVPIDCAKLAKALRENKLHFPAPETDQ
jgi:hypothetical protein